MPLCLQFRFILDNDFVRKSTWPELVPAMKAALQMNLLNKSGTLDVRAYNVLVALQAMVKPFRVCREILSFQW